jgi:large-conductance mechanosensitive channel
VHERRRIVLGAVMHDAPAEPEVLELGDFEPWRAWARDMVVRLQELTHPRVRAADGTMRQFPLWATTTPELGRAMGVRIRLYFEFAHFLGGCCLFGLVGAAASLALNVNGGPDESRSIRERLAAKSAKAGISPWPQGWLFITTIGARAGCESDVCRSTSLAATVFDCLFVVFVCWGLHAFAMRITRVVREVDESVTSIADYTAHLHGFPRDVSPLQVQQHIEGVLEQRARVRLSALTPHALGTRAGAWAHAFYTDVIAGKKWAVFEVVPLLDNAPLLKAGVDKAPLEAEVFLLEKTIQRLLLLYDHRPADAPEWRKSLDQQTLSRLSRRLDSQRARLLRLRACISQQVVGVEYGVSSVIVSFHHEAGCTECLAAFADNPLLRLSQRIGTARVDTRYTPPPAPADTGVRSAPRPPAPRAIYASELPEPADMVLEHLSVQGSWANFVRRRVVDVAVGVLLAAGFSVFFWAEIVQQREEASGGESTGAAVISAYASLVSVLANLLMKQLIKRLVPLERRTLRSDAQLGVAFRLFVAQAVNMALIAPLVSSAVPSWLPLRLCSTPEAECELEGVCCVFGPRGLLFRGDHGDVSAEWFARVGSKILLTMVVQLVAINALPFVRRALRVAFSRLAFRHVWTLEAVLQLHDGGQLDLANRYGELMAYTAVVLIYAPGMPLLYLLGAANCACMYWVDKIALLRWHSQPPPFDTKMADLATSLLPSFVVAHCLFALSAYAITPGAGVSVELFLSSARSVSGAELPSAVARSVLSRNLLIASVLLVFGAFLFSRLHRSLIRSTRGLVLDAFMPYRVGAVLEGNPRLIDAISGCDHPVLREVDGVIFTPADVERGGDPWVQWINPMTIVFKLLGIHLSRPDVSRAACAAAQPLRVHFDEARGQQSTYAPEKHPFYREAFLWDHAASAPTLRPAHLPAGSPTKRAKAQQPTGKFAPEMLADRAALYGDDPLARPPAPR